MTRRAVALALVRSPPRPRFQLPELSRPGRRTVAWAGAVLSLLVLAYAVARESSVFAVRSVELTGVSPEAAADAREALRPLSGTSLVQVDAAAVERRLAALPTIRSATVDRSFPNGLRVHVTPERAVAVYRNGTRAWLVAESGRVIAAVDPTARPRLARIRIPEPARPAPGQSLTATARVALAALDALPPRFPTKVLYAQVESSGEVLLVVAGGLEVRLGEPTDLSRKLKGAAAVLRTITLEEGEVAGYLDASLPGTVVAASGSQLSSEG